MSATTPFTTATLVPELVVTDITRSLAFWCGLVGFAVRYDRPEEGFAYDATRVIDVIASAAKQPSPSSITR